MPSTLTARMRVGKQSKKIERNTLKDDFSEILLLESASIVSMIAAGFSVAQLKVVYSSVSRSTGSKGYGRISIIVPSGTRPHTSRMSMLRMAMQPSVQSSVWNRFSG